MAMSYEEALAVQRRHEEGIMAQEGVSAIGVKLRDDAFVLEVTLDPKAPVPHVLQGSDIDGLPLVVVRGRYELQ
jgi:hypothetical protein